MEFLEKDLEEILKSTPTQKLKNAGLEFLSGRDRIFTQLKIGNYGVADVIFCSRYDNYIDITVAELKKDKIGISAFLQALRYAKGIQRFFEERGYKEDFDGMLVKSFYNVSISIILIGRKLDTEGSFCFLPEFVPNKRVEFYTYAYEFDGIKFKNEHGYKLVEEGF